MKNALLFERISNGCAGVGLGVILLWELAGDRVDLAPAMLFGNHGGIGYMLLAIPIAFVGVLGLIFWKLSRTSRRIALALNVMILVWLMLRFVNGV